MSGTGTGRGASEEVMDHPGPALSAHLDAALGDSEREAVELHLAACADCRAVRADLGSVARLTAALPMPARQPAIPRLAAGPSWLRPLRSLSAVATGAFVLLFMMSATLATAWGMGGGGKATEGRAARELNAPAATRTPRAQPAGDAGPQSLTGGRATASPPVVRVVPGQAPGAGPETQAGPRPEPPEIGPTPWLWLALAALSAATALLAHRRLRRGRDP